MGAKKKGKKLKSLSQGRPPTLKTTSSASRKSTRTLIRTHHTLQKQREKALNNGDVIGAASILKEIDSHGGIEAYQRASLTGQRTDRGGDSSKLLLEWLEPVILTLKSQSDADEKFKMLEVGALSTSNACSKSHLFEMERIDLNSQAEGIQQQDFMDRPIPETSKEKFHIISLSLVLNYVPDAITRGDMLMRTLEFLKQPPPLAGLQDFFPGLFLVLPVACVANSRYLDESRLETIMESIGYLMVRKRTSNKLVYYLWRMGSATTAPKVVFKKVEVRSGKSRNNFAVVMK